MDIFDSFKEAKRIYGSELVDKLLTNGATLKNILNACEDYVKKQEKQTNLNEK